MQGESAPTHSHLSPALLMPLRYETKAIVTGGRTNKLSHTQDYNDFKKKLTALEKEQKILLSCILH